MINVMTKDKTGTENTSMTMAAEGANEEARNLDLARKDKNPKEVRPLRDLLDKTDDKLEDSLMEFIANTSNGLPSDHSARSDVFTENTQVKELSDDYEVSMINEGYLQQLNRVNIYDSATHRAVPCHPVQLHEINYNHPEYDNAYTLENYISPAHSGTYFPQGANRLLVGDTERLEEPCENIAAPPKNGRSEESIIHGLNANEFRDVKVEAYNTHQRETDFPFNHNELSHSDHYMFGGPYTPALKGMSSTVQQHSFEDSPRFFQNGKTKEIVPSADVTLPVLRADSFLSHQSINETPDILDADSFYSNQENHIQRKISVPVQEALNRSQSYELLQERPSIFSRQTSCPSTESEIDHVSSDEEQQREFECALENCNLSSPHFLPGANRLLVGDIPGISLIYKLRDDIRNIRMEDSHSHRHTRSDNEYVPEHGVNAYDSESQRVVPYQLVQLQETNDDHSQYRNGYKFDNFNLPSPHYGIHFPPADNRLFPLESNVEAQRNGRSEEVNELANELRDVQVYDYNIHHREMEFPVYNNEPLLFDHHIFGGPDVNSFPHPSALEGISSITHEHCFKNNAPFSQNEETTKSIPSANVTQPVLAVAESVTSHERMNETCVHQENSLSGEVNFSVQIDDGEVLLRSQSYESLHRDQERHFAFSRQLSFPSAESETVGVSFDESLQRDFEYALELQQQLNHEVLMEDEAFTRHLDNSQHQMLSPPEYGSRRTEFFGPWAEEMISLNPQRGQQRPQHSNKHLGRHRRESAANRDGWRNSDQSPEGMISFLQDNRGNRQHRSGNPQGNPQGVTQHRVEVAKTIDADCRIPFDSEYQSVRQSSGRTTIRDRPIPHRFEPDPVKRVERILSHIKHLNGTSLNPQDQHISTDPENLPAVSLTDRLHDIRNVRLEDSLFHHYPRSDNEFVPVQRVNVYESNKSIPGHPVQLQEINYNHQQYENEYTLENYILPLEGMISTAHHHNLENNQTFSQNDETREIITSEAVTIQIFTAGNSTWSSQRMNETPDSFEAVSSCCHQENDISGEISTLDQEALNTSQSCESFHRDQEIPSVFTRQIPWQSTESKTDLASFDEDQLRDFKYAQKLQQLRNHEIFMDDKALARHLDNSQHHTMSPPGYGSRRTEFFGPQTEEMINPQRIDRAEEMMDLNPERCRSEPATNSHRQRNRGLSSEDMTSLHQNNRSHRHHSPSNPQGNVQDVAEANVDDHRKPFDSEYQSARRTSGRDRPVPQRCEPDPVERFERIPGQSAQIDYSLITPFIQNYQEDRRQHDDKLEAREGGDQYHFMQQNWRTDVERIERIPGQSAQIDPSIITPMTRNYQEERRRYNTQIRHLEHARQWEHQEHDVQQNWRTGHDRLPNEEYHSSVVHPTYNDPDEVFEIEDGAQSVNIYQNSSMLRRPPTPLRPTFLIPAHGNLENNDHSRNRQEMMGEMLQQGLDQEHIEILPVHRFHAGNAGENTHCTICLDEYCNNDEIRTLSCLHMFHMACIDNWLKDNAVCPLCRRRICP